MQEITGITFASTTSSRLIHYSIIQANSRFLGYLIFTVSFFLSSSGIKSQDSAVIIVTGEVTEALSGRRIGHAHIINQNQLTGVISDEMGYFQIYGREGDKLFISAIGYDFEYYTVTASAIRGDTMDIVLKIRAYLLPEVVIFDINTYEKFKKKFMEIDPGDGRLHIPGIPEVKMNKVPLLRDTNYLQNPMTALMHPVTYFYYNYNRHEKNKRLYYELLERDRMNEVVKSKYGTELIMQLTGMGEDEVKRFIDWCTFDPRYLLTLTEYEVYILIKQKYREYLLRDGIPEKQE